MSCSESCAHVYTVDVIVLQIVEAGEIQERSEKVAGVLQAEMFHFQRERVIDFRQMMKEMLQEQITFYRDVSTSVFHLRFFFPESLTFLLALLLVRYLTLCLSPLFPYLRSLVN